MVLHAEFGELRLLTLSQKLFIILYMITKIILFQIRFKVFHLITNFINFIRNTIVKKFAFCDILNHMRRRNIDIVLQNGFWMLDDRMTPSPGLVTM